MDNLIEIEEMSTTNGNISGRVFAAFSRSLDRATISTTYEPMAVNQCIINEGTDDELKCRSYRETYERKALYYLLTICTLGLVLLIFYWKPEWRVWVRARASDVDRATHLVLHDKYQRNHVKTVKRLDPIDCSQFRNGDITTDNAKREDQESKHDDAVPYFSLSSISKNGLQPTKYFEHKFHKYLWRHDTFVPLRGLDCDTTIEKMKEMKSGLNESDKPDRRTLFGINTITIEITPIVVLLFREILNPYYAFQLFAVVVWCVGEYYSLPAVIVVMSTVSITLSLYLTRKQDIMIHKMSSGSGTVRVLVGDKFESRDSKSLLPGDVIEIGDKVDTLWCDCVLLSGNCVVSESMLTGESVPVLKTPLVSSTTEFGMEFFDPSRHKQHTLYGGTKVVDVQHHQTNNLPSALVIRTGFYTEKGKMIESMLSPSPMDYKYYNDSLKFILVMLLLGLFGAILAIVFLASLGAPASFIVKRVLDLITTIVPPGLPAALTVATIYAQRRLRLAKIFCISPPRIAISGKINCMCFDKTGTLTENDLKLWGVVPCKGIEQDSTQQIASAENEPSFYDAIHDYEKLPQYGKTGLECLNALACCHSLVTIDDKVTGDPVDLELFQATKWCLNQSTEKWSQGCSCVVAADDNNLAKIAIARVFQFNSVMQRMSVITKLQGDDKMQIYVKGAPETIITLCNQKSVPANFKQKLQFYTKQGYRVLALAHRTLENPNNDISIMERNIVESSLNFLGLVVMANPLKPRTTETISSLKTANIRTVMATGDNLETALYVAKKCCMINEADKIVIVEAEIEENTGDLKISWNLDCTRRGIKTMNPSHSKKTAIEIIESQLAPTYHLALTGKTLVLLREHSTRLFYRVLVGATVLARMKPDHKRYLVEGLQEMSYIVGMCGDGANDCGALKAAHSGIAIAEAETSIVAPFTSMRKDISSCLKLIREGRAALVTSFGMIKYLCVYCFAQYHSLLILFTINSYYSDMQFTFADVGPTGLVTLFFAVGGAAKMLSKKPPHLSLVSPIMLVCLFLQIALLILFQVSSFVLLQNQSSWYTRLEPNMTHPKDNILCAENTVMFYTSIFQNMMLAFIFYKGRPHRQPLYRNVPYFVGFLLLMIWFGILFFARIPDVDEFFGITTLNNDNVGFKFMLLSLYIANLICAIIVEKFLLESEYFNRLLKKIFRKCITKSRPRNNRVNEDQVEDIHYLKLQTDLKLDSSWPPVGQETIIRT
uniref:probable cation-transporting ATPase 13A4 isoform X1 n=2 Tax=Styela clava TaxID=7725 RepID=UPI00193AB0B0|nr:probable cation-transporting ATPase 13A4 isoform X1 [Styela clava]